MYYIPLYRLNTFPDVCNQHNANWNFWNDGLNSLVSRWLEGILLWTVPKSLVISVAGTKCRQHKLRMPQESVQEVEYIADHNLKGKGYVL